MKRISGYFLVLFFTAFTSGVLGAEVAVSVSVDKNRVALNDTVRMNVTVEGSGNVPEPKMPDLSAFNVYSSGRSQNISFVNGSMSSSVSYSYSLMPKSAGTFTIGPFTVEAEGRSFQSEPVTIEVTPSGASAPAPPSGAPSQAGAAPARSAPGAFARLTLDQSKAYVNEEVILRFRFYHRVSLVANPEYQPPELTGFIYEDLPPPRNFTESVNGTGYNVTEIKTALFPAKAGKIVIPPAQLKIAVQDFSRSNPDEFFSFFFQGGAKQYILRTDPVELAVLPLPSEGRPQDFSGGVGEFGLSASLDKPSSAAGEPLTLAVSVTGSGNVKSLGDPVFPEFAGFRKYDTASSLNIDKSQGTVRGSKTYKIVLVPQVSGPHTLSPIAFSYFNLKERKYKVLKTATISMQVKPGNLQASPQISAAFAAPEIQRMREEIRFIKTAAPSGRPFRWVYRTKAFLAINILPLGVLALAAAYRLKIILGQRNPEKRRMARALRRAGRELKAHRPLEALAGYFSDKMLSSPQGLTQRQAEEFLEKSGADAETIAQVKQLWSDLEMAHYAPSQFKPEGLADLAGRARNLLKKLERILPIILLVCLSSPALFSQEPDSPGRRSLEGAFQEGSRLYQEGKFSEAARQYETFLSQAGESAALEYNLGNAFYRSGQFGEALVHWVRAYRMDPLDADIRDNLRLGSARAGDAFFLDVVHFCNLNTLSMLWLAVLWAACLLFSVYLFRGMSPPVLSSAALLSVLILTGWLFLHRLNDEAWKAWAVVTAIKTEVRSGPGEQFAVGFTVPEGRRVVVLEESYVPGWEEIGIPSEGLRGWIPANAFKKI